MTIQVLMCQQLTSSEISKSGSGIPIAIKDNINVKNWEPLVLVIFLKALYFTI